MRQTETDADLDRQYRVLLDADRPDITRASAGELAEAVEKLREPLRSALAQEDRVASRSWVPFVLVVGPLLAAAEDLVPTLRLDGGSAAGVVDRNHGEAGLAAYRPLPELGVPESGLYALIDVERGEEFCGVRPKDALPVLAGRGRTPLTIHEGIALVAHFPSVLEKNACFMLSGSRRGDKRVPALWISDRAPKVGWCWEGNPHTWLGTASAGARLA